MYMLFVNVTDVMFSVCPDSQFQFHLEGEEGCLRTLSPVLEHTKVQGKAERTRKVKELTGMVHQEERKDGGLRCLTVSLQLMTWKVYPDGCDLTSNDIT